MGREKDVCYNPHIANDVKVPYFEPSALEAREHKQPEHVSNLLMMANSFLMYPSHLAPF